MGRYLALVRGINVGGKNLIRMTELAECFERNGFTRVMTYIQSGNVLFDAAESSSAKLTARVERMLAERFAYEASVVLRTRRQLQAVVLGAPKKFGTQPARYRYDVLYLKPPLTPAAAIKGVPQREGVDRAVAGNGVLYFSRLISRAAESRLSRIVGTPIYQNVTIRNWNTTTKLYELISAGAKR